MPTLAEWDQALSTARSVRVESSPALLTDVARKQVQRDAYLAGKNRALPHRKPLKAVPEFDPHTTVSVAPLHLLHRLGVVTTPAIENLADLCSTWAYYRYLWAFTMPSGSSQPRLALSEHARGIDFHQKGLLSDQIGVGMAAVLMEQVFNVPLAADVDVAIDDPAWPIELQLTTSPDYLFFDEFHTRVFVVECKGTQSSRSDALNQIRRGTEQVPSLVFQDGRRADSLVIATRLGAENSIVYVLDPPPDEIEASGKDSNLPSGKERSAESPSSAERISEREWYIKDPEQFALSTRLISEAKVLAYGGSDSAAITKLERAKVPLTDLPRSEPRSTVVEETDVGTFTGLRQALPTGGRLNVEIFQGIEQAVRNAYISDDVPRMREELSDFRSKVKTSTLGLYDAGPVRVQRTETSITVNSTSADGTLLSVTVRAR